jgi:hypothetical protein
MIAIAKKLTNPQQPDWQAGFLKLLPVAERLEFRRSFIPLLAMQASKKELELIEDLAACRKRCWPQQRRHERLARGMARPT